MPDPRYVLRECWYVDAKVYEVWDTVKEERISHSDYYPVSRQTLDALNQADQDRQLQAMRRNEGR